MALLELAEGDPQTAATHAEVRTSLHGGGTLPGVARSSSHAPHADDWMMMAWQHAACRQEGSLAFGSCTPSYTQHQALYHPSTRHLDPFLTHLQKALALSSKHFGERSALTGHRLLRLGVAKFGLGQLTEAAGQLHRALGILQVW